MATPSHAAKKGTRYRYYVSRPLITKDQTQKYEGSASPLSSSRAEFAADSKAASRRQRIHESLFPAGDPVEPSFAFGQSGKPILGRLGFVFPPLDQKPLVSAQLAQQVVAMRRPHSPSGKARGEPIRGSLAPSDRLLGLWRQPEGQGLDRDRLVMSPLQPRLRPFAPR
jgi:hypothetical protein